ncbi:hypothetical protein ABW20_dc0101013 [Dactylellina cionopaga]|nr:hypothetical protein ABW20_dc0101013 [Dactylellina cionopaga]
MSSRLRRDDIVVVISSSPSPEPLPSASKGNALLDKELADLEAHLELPEPLLPDIDMQDVAQLEPQAQVPSLDECLAALLTLFPDVDPAYIRGVHKKHAWDQGRNIVDFLADQILEAHGHYPKIQRDDKPAKHFPPCGSVSLSNIPTQAANKLPLASRKLLRNSFPFIPAQYIDQTLTSSDHYIFLAFRELAQAEANYDKAEEKLYKKLTRSRKAVTEDAIAEDAAEMGPEEHANLIEEFTAAKRIYETLTGWLIGATFPFRKST